MKISIAVIPGDGIGAEVIPVACDILSLICGFKGVSLDLQYYDWGYDRFLKDGVSLPAGGIEAIRDKHDCILFGAIGDPRASDMSYARDILLGLRSGFNLSVNHRPLYLYDGESELLKTVNIFRENTQGIYQGIGGNVMKSSAVDVAIDSCIYTKENVSTFIEYCFNKISRSNNCKVTLVHKANAIPNTGKLWLKQFYQLGVAYPNLELSDEYVDSFCYQFVSDKTRYVNVLCPNLFGDIVSDLGAAFVGGLGYAPSANINPCSGVALFEPVHGSAPDIVATGKANPAGSILSAAMLLDYFGFNVEASQLRDAVIKVRHELYLKGREATTIVVGEMCKKIIISLNNCKAR